MTTSGTSFVFPDKGMRRSRLQYLFHLVLLNVIVIAISFGAVFYSLGYKINPTTHAIERTGLLTFTSPIDQERVEIWVDDKQVGTQLPFRSDPLFPGRYHVALKRDGYQSWYRTVDIEANKVTSFKYVTLIREVPIVRESTESDQSYVYTSSVDTKGIDIRENELWVNDRFVTRFSNDIISAAWFPDRGHVVYQIDTELRLLELVSNQSQLLATLTTEEPAIIRFKNNGRLMLFTDAEAVRVLELY